MPGDSGGATFVKRGDQWQLAGVMFTIPVYEGQPYDTHGVFGNRRYSVDVAFYRSQIDSIMNGPPQIPALPWPALLLCAAALAAAATLARPGRARALTPCWAFARADRSRTRCRRRSASPRCASADFVGLLASPGAGVRHRRPRLLRRQRLPVCSSSIEMSSGERTKAMWPSRGGRLMVTPASMQALAGGVDVVHRVGEVAEVAPAGVAPRDPSCGSARPAHRDSRRAPRNTSV